MFGPYSDEEWGPNLNPADSVRTAAPCAGKKRSQVAKPHKRKRPRYGRGQHEQCFASSSDTSSGLKCVDVLFDVYREIDSL